MLLRLPSGQMARTNYALEGVSLVIGRWHAAARGGGRRNARSVTLPSTVLAAYAPVERTVAFSA